VNGGGDPDEDASVFAELHQALLDQFQPDSALEHELVENLVDVLWCLRRVPPIEAGLFQAAHHRACIDAARPISLQPFRPPLRHWPFRRGINLVKTSPSTSSDTLPIRSAWRIRQSKLFT
jgi:hypothetical protein